MEVHSVSVLHVYVLSRRVHNIKSLGVMVPWLRVSGEKGFLQRREKRSGWDLDLYFSHISLWLFRRCVAWVFFFQLRPRRCGKSLEKRRKMPGRKARSVGDNTLQSIEIIIVCRTNLNLCDISLFRTYVHIWVGRVLVWPDRKDVSINLKPTRCYYSSSKGAFDDTHFFFLLKKSWKILQKHKNLV